MKCVGVKTARLLEELTSRERGLAPSPALAALSVQEIIEELTARIVFDEAKKGSAGLRERVAKRWRRIWAGVDTVGPLPARKHRRQVLALYRQSVVGACPPTGRETKQ